MSGLEELRDVVRAPLTEAGRRLVREVRSEPVIVDGAGQVRRRSFVGAAFLVGRSARRVARPAVAEPLHEVGAAVPARVVRRVRAVGVGVEEDEIPQRHAPALIERERQVRLGRLQADRRDRMHEVRVHRGDVVVGDLRERRVRHRRIQMMARRDTAAQRAVEVLQRPSADAGIGIRRDVRRIDLADRRLQREAAGERGLAGNGVARVAVAQPREIGAARDQRVVHRALRRRVDRGLAAAQRRGDHAERQDDRRRPHEASRPHDARGALERECRDTTELHDDGDCEGVATNGRLARRVGCATVNQLEGS